jgi:DNA primase
VANELAAHLGVEPGLVLEYFRKSAAERRQNAPAPPKNPTRPAERILLNLLVTNGDARRQLIPRLKPLGVLEKFPTHRIFRKVFALDEAGEGISFDSVHGRLEENDRELLETALLAGEAGDAGCSLEQGEECVRSLERSDRQAQLGILKARIRECEGAGDMTGALRLNEELRRLERSGL